MQIPEFHPESCALIKQYLTQALFEQLAPVKTRAGFTLEAAIRSGLKNPDSSVGIYAGDAESYSVFSAILDPIINAYHTTGKSFKHMPGLTFVRFPLIDPDKAFILSTRVRVARNLNGFSFPCHATAQDRKKIESLISSAVQSMPQNLKGSYLSFKDVNLSHMQDLLSQKLAFKKGDRFQEAAGMNRDFPESRGIFYSRDKTVRIWVNEEDHLRVISMEASSDISGVFNRLVSALDHLSTRLEFAFDKKYGFLTSCPTNIGTAMRAGVHIRLKKLEKNQDLLNSLVNRYQLQIRGTKGEKTKVDQAVFDISNRQRFGLSETRIIRNLHTGIAAIIDAEKNL
jgi:creatine kinase/arginine kinase